MCVAAREHLPALAMNKQSSTVVNVVVSSMHSTSSNSAIVSIQCQCMILLVVTRISGMKMCALNASHLSYQILLLVLNNLTNKFEPNQPTPSQPDELRPKLDRDMDDEAPAAEQHQQIAGTYHSLLILLQHTI